MIPRWIVTPGHGSTLNCDPGSLFHVELWPQLKFWPWIRITIQFGILTRGHSSTWIFDPGSQFSVEFWPAYISSTRGIATQEGVRIQQRDQNSTAKEGHNSTKNPLNIDPGSVFNWGGQNFILHRQSQFSALFSSMLWRIELKFCISLSRYEHKVKFECRQFPSIFVGVMPLLELRIVEIHSFPHFPLTCFDILSWNVAYDLVLLYYRPSLSVVNFCRRSPFWN